jgi:hypothetical protein
MGINWSVLPGEITCQAMNRSENPKKIQLRALNRPIFWLLCRAPLGITVIFPWFVTGKRGRMGLFPQ